MALDVNGFVLAGGTEFLYGSSGTKMDSGGRIVVANNPGVHGSTIIDGSVINEYPQQVNSLTFNSGAWTGNTTFTAPVAGLYFISAAHIMSSTGNNTTASDNKYGYTAIIKNGASYCFAVWQTNDSWTPLIIQTLALLALGDTIAIAVNAAPGPVGPSTGMYRSNHNSMSIVLIG